MKLKKKIKTKIRKKKEWKKILFKWIVLCEERYK
jgi:long-subunit acyl-CoA synthetase (AMP-forming)